MFNHPIHDYVLSYINEFLKKLPLTQKLPSLQLEMLTHYMASAFIGTLKWWVDKDMPCTVEEVDEHFKKFMMHGIRETLGL